MNTEEKKKEIFYYGLRNSEYGFTIFPEKCDTYVEVPPEDHNKLMEGICDGKMMIPDENGYPILADQKRDYLSESIYKLEDLRAELNSISVVEWMSMHKDLQNEWSRYLKDLNDVQSQSGWPDNVIWPIKPAT